ncbi:ABC transporter permease [Actinoplanes sp. LDG1-06]|uniref:ABC transporter permease n=1 Tax=Paractinoplanes ovalisporus TaxID=2810368 RepID=A0ABS2A627_9ACTN|nr:ABC transporter permease [Actinoplanes ovalisporus]MBM2614691.1 ABC transporter permease [Actinoplanes ovalisporus]
MLRLVGGRALMAVPLLFIVSILSFVLASFTPGSIAASILGTGATPEQIARVEQQLGTDRPVLSQYGDWLAAAVRGDLGSSLFNGESVTALLASRMSITLSLAIAALLFAVVLGVALGAFSAIRGGIAARITDGLSVLLMSVPNFWFATILLAVLAVQLGLFSVSGYVPFGVSPRDWVASLFLPVIALMVGSMASLALNTRSEMLTVLKADFVKSLRANGIPVARILFVHTLRNAAAPLLPVVGLLFVGLLGGTVLMEQIFGMGGLGALAVTATTQHDLPVIQGIVVFYTLAVIVVFLVLDVLVSYVNPKVRAS